MHISYTLFFGVILGVFGLYTSQQLSCYAPTFGVFYGPSCPVPIIPPTQELILAQQALVKSSVNITTPLTKLNEVYVRYKSIEHLLKLSWIDEECRADIQNWLSVTQHVLRQTSNATELLAVRTQYTLWFIWRKYKDILLRIESSQNGRQSFGISAAYDNTFIDLDQQLRYLQLLSSDVRDGHRLLALHHDGEHLCGNKQPTWSWSEIIYNNKRQTSSLQDLDILNDFKIIRDTYREQSAQYLAEIEHSLHIISKLRLRNRYNVYEIPDVITEKEILGQFIEHLTSQLIDEHAEYSQSENNIVLG